MSSAVTPLHAPRPAGMPPRTTRPRLRLVGAEERLDPEARGAPVECGVLVERGASVESGACVECGGCVESVGPDGCACAPASPATHLTRRGRLALTLLAIVAVAALAVVLATSVDAAALKINHSTTVSAGQTLSEVAAAQLPSLPIHEGVARIQLLNGLNTPQVHAGQSLLIPVVP